MNYDSAKQTFARETEELLERMETALLSLEENPGDSELLNDVFRAMHTIKGTAGVFGLDSIVSFTHAVETAMDTIRAGERALNESLIAVFLECKDHTADLVEATLIAEDQQALDPALASRSATLVARLGGECAVGAMQATDGSMERDGEAQKLEGKGMSEDNWVISLLFGNDSLRNGMDPLSFLRYLCSLGEIVEIITLTDRLPRADEFDAESCYLGFDVFFHSDADKQTIEGVFEFVEDDCSIQILPPNSRVEQYLALLNSQRDDQVPKIGEMLVQIGALTKKEVEKALSFQADCKGEPGEGVKLLGEILVEQKAVHAPVVEQALEKQKKAKERAGQDVRYIRVDSERLGHLINLVGELVIGCAAMKVLVERHGFGEVQEMVGGVEHLVEEIRDNALQLRMVQIGDTFSRFRRVVRDASKDLGKDIELVITGGETELDKTVVEKINDPLTHLVRNAVDHGIENPEERIAKGKPAKGTVQLNAFHDSGRIVIEIKDDGAGLDPQRIRAKAEAKGLVNPEQNLSHEETLRLIFEPGLSTKEQASNLSGRGVGMDVVRRNIEALRGTIELQSEPGLGTRVTIVLPLTLAIIDGFLVGAGGERYVIPLAQVAECVEFGAFSEVKREDRHYVNLRGEVLPYVRLREFFDIRSADRTPAERQSLVVARFGHTKVGLVVDELHGEQQTVIKPLGKLFECLRGVAGATVLGTGDIALILNIQEVTELANGSRMQRAVGARGHLTH